VLEEEFLKAFKNIFFPIKILNEDNRPENWMKILLSFDLNGLWLIEYLLAGSTIIIFFSLLILKIITNDYVLG
jgi:hypothetical protein